MTANAEPRHRYDREAFLGGAFIVAAIVAFVAALAGDLDTLMFVSGTVALVCFLVSRDKLGMVGAALTLVTLRLMMAAVVAQSWRALLASIGSLAVVAILFRIAVKRNSERGAD